MLSNFRPNEDVSDEIFNTAIERLAKEKLVAIGDVPVNGRLENITLTPLGIAMKLKLQVPLALMYPSYFEHGVTAYTPDKRIAGRKALAALELVKSFLDSFHPPLSNDEAFAVVKFFLDRAKVNGGNPSAVP